MRRNKWLMMLAGAVAFGFGFLSTVRSAPADERFDLKIRNDFFAGFAGDSDALASGMKKCETALAENPKNAEALVWHGAGLYYQGGLEYGNGDQQKGLALVQRGMGEMAHAVQLEPDNVAVLIPRGSAVLQSTLYMPEGEIQQQMIKLGLGDYKHTYELQSKYFDTLGVHPRGELMSGIANAEWHLGNTEEAQRWFQLIATQLKGSEYQTRADKWLKTKSLDREESQCYGCHTAK